MASNNPPKKASGGGSGMVRALLFLGFALLAGVAAIWVLWTLVSQFRSQIDAANKPMDQQYVIVAYADLYQGVTISEDDLFAVEIPPAYLYKGGNEGSMLFTSPEHVVGRIPRERILANEFIREERLADPEAGIGLNAIIPRGMRAISMNIQDGAALAGFLQPGNKVDVLVTITPEDGSGASERQTLPLLQAAYVLAVNQRFEKKEKEKKHGAIHATAPSVTMAVTPNQAEQLAHASKVGKVTLTLRNDIDQTTVNLTAVTTEIIAPGEKQPEPPKKIRKAAPKIEAPVQEEHVIQVFNGVLKTEWKADSSGQLKSSGS